MVRGGLWGKECAPKSFECPVRDRKSSILNRGDFPGIAPELIKIDVLVIGVLLEKLKLEILNSGPNGAPGGPSGVPERSGGTWRILTFSFFASNDYLKGRGGSRKRGGRPKRGPGEGFENLIRSLGALFGRSGAANERQGASRGGWPHARGMPGACKPEKGGGPFTSI